MSVSFLSGKEKGFGANNDRFTQNVPDFCSACPGTMMGFLRHSILIANRRGDERIHNNRPENLQRKPAQPGKLTSLSSTARKEKRTGHFTLSFDAKAMIRLLREIHLQIGEIDFPILFQGRRHIRYLFPAAGPAASAYLTIKLQLPLAGNAGCAEG